MGIAVHARGRGLRGIVPSRSEVKARDDDRKNGVVRGMSAKRRDEQNIASCNELAKVSRQRAEALAREGR